MDTGKRPAQDPPPEAKRKAAVNPRAALEKWLLLPPPPVSPVHQPALDALRPELIVPFRPEDCSSKPVVINNLVFRVDTGSTFNFLPLFGSLMGVRRKRVKFPQALVRTGNVDTDRWETLIVYTSGLFVLCGMRTEMTAIRALQMFRMDLHQANIPIGLKSFTPVNVVVNVMLPFDVDIFAANDSRQLLESSVTPDQFPGMTFKMRRVQVLAFANGRCVLTGADDFIEMERVRSMVHEALLPFKVERAESVRHRPGESKGGKRGQKNMPSAMKKDTPATAATPKRGGATGRRGRRPRVPKPSAEVVGADDSRVGGRAGGVAFKLNERVIVKPDKGPVTPKPSV